MDVSTHLKQCVGLPRSSPGDSPVSWLARAAHLHLLALLLSAAPGCQVTNPLYDGKNWLWDKDTKVEHPVSADSIVYSGGQVYSDKQMKVLGGDYDQAIRLYQDKQYAEAEPIFESIAENTKNTLQYLELARYYQCECLYRTRKYPKAAEHYIQLLNNFPSAQKGPEVRQRLFDIGNYWLDETRDAMEADREVQEGKRWFVWPSSFVHFDETKPTFDMEGRAIKALEEVYLTDPKGELGERALFLIGSVHFYHSSYRDADHYFYQLVQTHPNGKFAPKALELAIVCKTLSQGGPDYDARKLQEARDLINMARRSYPELAKGADKFLTKQEFEIHQVEAEHDYNIAKFWDRTGHPGSAYFYYEVVRRRYPGSEFADIAAKRMLELKVRAEQEQKRNEPVATKDHPAPLEEGAPLPRPIVPGQQPVMSPSIQPPQPPSLLPPGMAGPPR
jgi:TolA-binding protein